MVRVNVNNDVNVRIAGHAALREALGVDNSVRFMQQFWYRSGDYTKEKYEKPEPSREEVIARIMANRAQKAG
ncbi:MAG: hypothetical protein LUH23_09920 [Oscillospiraceae bacterium]|nr:hypothetical protein [Oscillospiraceae bacterium]